MFIFSFLSGMVLFTLTMMLYIVWSVREEFSPRRKRVNYTFPWTVNLMAIVAFGYSVVAVYEEVSLLLVPLPAAGVAYSFALLVCCIRER